MRRSEWDKRIQRATDLAARSSYVAEVLRFYSQVLTFQRAIYNEMSSQPIFPESTSATFRQRLDPGDVLRYLPALLSLAQEKGPGKLAEDVTVIRSASASQHREMIQNFLAGERTWHSFFAHALLQPYAEHLAVTTSSSPRGEMRPICPVCGSRPQVATLRPEGDGGKRFLLCSLCLTEWEFRRILCPACGEEDHKKLPRYSAEEIEPVRVEACDTCHYYLKSIDMTIDGLAVPLVDEAATVPLDLWATEHGYKKVQPNLMGF